MTGAEYGAVRGKGWRVDVADGKYSYCQDEIGNATALRYGEPWARDVTGDKFVYCLAAELRDSRAERDQLLADRARMEALLVRLTDALGIVLTQFGPYEDGQGAAKYHAVNIGTEALAAARAAIGKDGASK